MGLDSVEIVMKVEETFNITIADHDAEKCITPRDVIDLVMSNVGHTVHSICLSQRAFYRLRASFIKQLGVKRNQIRLETRLAELSPHSSRKEQLAQVIGSLGVAKHFDLAYPRWLHKFPASLETVAGLSRWFVVNGPQVVEAPPRQWNREQVAESVRQIVIDQLGCENIYREDAHFVKDLGMA